MSLLTNTNLLQALIEQANNLADAGGGGGEIAGTSYLSGSFTLAEDVTSGYVVVENFMETYADFVATLESQSKTTVATCTNTMLWLSRLEEEDSYNNYPRMLVGCIGTRTSKGAAGGTPFAVLYASSTDSSLSVTKQDTANSEYNGVFRYRYNNDSLTAYFTANQKGYAGKTYNWVIMGAN